MIDSPFDKKTSDIKIPKVEIPKVEVFKEKIETLKVDEDKESQEPIESSHAKILKSYGGVESNIPINHGYWKLRP